MIAVAKIIQSLNILTFFWLFLENLGISVVISKAWEILIKSLWLWARYVLISLIPRSGILSPTISVSWLKIAGLYLTKLFFFNTPLLQNWINRNRSSWFIESHFPWEMTSTVCQNVTPHAHATLTSHHSCIVKPATDRLHELYVQVWLMCNQQCTEMQPCPLKEPFTSQAPNIIMQISHDGNPRKIKIV